LQNDSLVISTFMFHEMQCGIENNNSIVIFGWTILFSLFTKAANWHQGRTRSYKLSSQWFGRSIFVTVERV